MCLLTQLRCRGAVWHGRNTETEITDRAAQLLPKPPAVMTDGTQFSCGQFVGSMLALQQFFFFYSSRSTAIVSYYWMGAKGSRWSSK